jgi:hypothetical protein
MSATLIAQIGDEILRDIEAFVSRFVAKHYECSASWIQSTHSCFLQPASECQCEILTRIVVPRQSVAISVFESEQ